LAAKIGECFGWKNDCGILTAIVLFLANFALHLFRGYVKRKIITFCIVLSSVIVVGGDANNGSHLNILLIIMHLGRYFPLLASSPTTTAGRNCRRN